MTVIRAACNHCEAADLELAPADVTVVVNEWPYYGFTCPACRAWVRKDAPPEVVALLKTGGVYPLVVVPDAEPLTEDDLIAFGLALEAGNVEEIA